MANPVIRCSHLYHRYGKNEVIKNLNFEIQRGGIYGLLGKNGAGKTTTINILMGYIEPCSGVCEVLGDASHNLQPVTRSKIGLLHEGFTQYDFMTIEQIEKFYSKFYQNWKSHIFWDLVFKLKVPSSRKLSKLSFGQKSQVCLGLLMAQSPELMILDDYSMGLDVGYRRLLLDYLKDYVDEHGTTVLLTSHIVQDLERLIDHMLIIQDGQLLYSASRGHFFENLKQWKYELDLANGVAMPFAPNILVSLEQINKHVFVSSFKDEALVKNYLRDQGLELRGWHELPLSFEDAFLCLTGKY
ncbi:ATP-binding cassette domain-containing protein [Taylorella equigenitalis]|uniref:ABC transporter ATP-binding protein n=1 Tax=Taylorella equigenitalis TaxID=29575 RepID=UPI000413A31D|nr:ABC transporter ATP-binding protein [Taylorella equigenitalis]ASY40229.1 ABC transporter ATP-binding protein [Taylorella equigenitalis]